MIHEELESLVTMYQVVALPVHFYLYLAKGRLQVDHLVSIHSPWTMATLFPHDDWSKSVISPLPTSLFTQGEQI